MMLATDFTAGRFTGLAKHMKSLRMRALPNCIHLWFCDSEAILDQRIKEYYLSILSPREKEQMDRFVFDKDKTQHLITRALVRTVLSHYCPAIAPMEWSFCSSKYGKPRIVEQQNRLGFSFNLSHTKGLIVLALATDLELGIDVEYVDPSRNWPGIAKYSFSQAEVDYIQSSEETRQLSAFYEIWTMKEAYLKATGEGLSVPLDGFSFLFGGGHKSNTMEFRPNSRGCLGSWSFWRIDAGASYKSALAANGAVKGNSINIQSFKVVPGVQIDPYECRITYLSTEI